MSEKDTYLTEIQEYYFPDLTIEDLQQEPYKAAADTYIELSRGTNFFRGFFGLSDKQRAQIYRAVYLLNTQTLNEPDMVGSLSVLATDKGDIIRYSKPITDELLNIFDRLVENSEKFVFIPENYGQTSSIDLYYRIRVLEKFLGSTQINGIINRVSLGTTYFLVLFLEDSRGSENIEEKWYQFHHGGLEKEFLVPLDKLEAVFILFKWSQRVRFRLEGNEIYMTVRVLSQREFNNKLNRLSYLPERKLTYVDLPEVIEDEIEAFGIVRMFPDKQILPLIGTSRVYYEGPELSIWETLEKQQHLASLPDDTEIFTYEDFGSMNLYRKASLIQTPTGHWLSLLHLYQNNFVDPYRSHESWPSEFIEKIKIEIGFIVSDLMMGFPPPIFEPSLYVEYLEEENIAIFYLQTETSSRKFFYIYSEDPEVIEQMETTLVSKLHNGSLLGPENRYEDIYLLFNPQAYFVFETMLNIDHTGDSSGLYDYYLRFYHDYLLVDL